MTLLMVFPLVTTIWLGFHQLLLRDLDNPTWVGWSNYTEILGDADFWASARWTILFVAITVPAQMILGLSVALVLDRVGRGRSIYLSGLLLPFIVTPVIGALIYKDLFERGGLLSWLYEAVFDSALVVNNDNIKYLIILQAIWSVMPFAMVTFFAGIQTLPEERVEAAAIDGAGFWRQLWHITIPHLRTLIMFVALISIMDAYRVFDTVFVWTGGGFPEAQTLQVYNLRVATSAEIGRLGKGNAMAILNVLGIFVVLIPFLVRSYKDQIAERD